MGHPTNLEVPGRPQYSILHKPKIAKPRYIKSGFVLNGTFFPNQFVVVIIFMLIQCALLVNSFVLDEAKLINTSVVDSDLRKDLASDISVVSNSSDQSLVGGSSPQHHHQWGKNNQSGCDGDHHDHDDKKVEQILLDIFQEEPKLDDDEEEEILTHDSVDESNHDDSGLNIDEIVLSDEQDQLDDDAEDSQTEPTPVLVRSRRSVQDNSTDESRGFHHHHHARGRKKSNNRHAAPQKGNKSRRPTQNRRTNKNKSSKNVNKYNDYMDVVLKRMNSMIKTKQMDPLMVNLFSGGNNKENKDKEVVNKKKKKKSTTRKKRKGAKNRGRSEDLDEDEEEDEELVEEVEDDHDHHFVMLRSDQQSDSNEDDDVELDNDHDRASTSGFRRIRALIINGSMKRSAPLNTSEESTTTTAATTTTTKAAPTTTPAPTKTEQRGFDKKKPSSNEEEEVEEEPRKSSNKNKNTKQQSSSSKKKSKPNKNSSTKKKQPSQKPTRGVLKGLSSLRRNGNVDVIRQGDKVRIVRANFLLGPVTLEIVPKIKESEGRGKQGSKKKKSTVTAIAHQLKGIIEVRLKKNSPTTIKRLRVFPPSSVKIKSSSKKVTSHTSNSSSSSVPRYSKVTPVATQRLRQIATAVVRQADVKRKTSELHADSKKQS